MSVVSQCISNRLRKTFRLLESPSNLGGGEAFHCGAFDELRTVTGVLGMLQVARLPPRMIRLVYSMHKTFIK